AGGAGGDGEHGDDGLPGSSGLGGNGGHANSGAQAGSNTAAIGGTGGGETGSNGIDAGNYTGGSGAGGSSYSGGVTDGTTTAGLRSGNGLIKITYIEKIYCISNRVAVDVTVNPLTIGGSIAGTATIIYGSSTGTMTLSGHIGTIQRWERKLNSGSWETITNTTTTHSETPTLVGTWYYRVSVKSGVCLETYSSEFTVTVNKADSTVTTWPTATAITYGQTLADSTLNSGDSTPAGSFAFTTPATAPNIGTAGHSVTFTPTDTDNYNGLTGTASVTVDPIAPTIATVVATAITTKTATSGGSISSDGGATISAKGVCYGETANPTTAGVCVPDASADTTFSVSLTGLTVATTYFYRAFATNSVSTTYGNNLSFTTLNALSITAGQTFLVDENSSALTVVGTVVITGDIQGSVIYAITAGNDAGGFAINSSTGEITVASQSVLDFEITPTFVLTISATDDENSDSETVAIDLNNLNDSDPILSDVEWSLSEVADIGTVVGTITAVDGDGDLNTISYAIIAGNDAGVFAIDSATGQVTVADNSTLDFELTTQYILTVEASDGTHATEAFATINITDENGVCGEAEVVGELPYTHTSSTTDRPSSLTAYGESCIEEEYPSPDFVYSIELETGDRIEITLDPANGFDGVLLLLGNCGEDEDCLDAINEFGIGENEVIHYEATEDETLFIVVEGVSDASGNYILTVEEWAAETPDETTDDLSDEDSESETPDETVDEANTASDDDTADSGDSADDTDSGDTGDDTGDSVNDSDELIDDDTSETDEDYPTNSNNGCGCSMVL
ncbi:cadherin repeat domain-containing protein, partial [bacterium]|nr:cadherin repeat domain-containing protein [bacterium]